MSSPVGVIPCRLWLAVPGRREWVDVCGEVPANVAYHLGRLVTLLLAEAGIASVIVVGWDEDGPPDRRQAEEVWDGR